MINYSIGMKPNPTDKSAPKKAYAYAQYTDSMDLNDFAEHIASHGSVYARADIAAVLTLAVDCMREQLLCGMQICLGDLGKFYVSLQSEGADSIADFNSATHIKDVLVKWSPGSRFCDLHSEATFNLVPSRKMAAALLKAIKSGDESMDLGGEETTPDNSDTTENGTGNSGNDEGGSTDDTDGDTTSGGGDDNENGGSLVG